MVKAFTIYTQAFTDASYGAFAKSAKHKIVKKFHTEAELVCLLDTTSQAIYIRNLIIAQGYEVGLAEMCTKTI